MSRVLECLGFGVQGSILQKKSTGLFSHTARSDFDYSNPQSL